MFLAFDFFWAVHNNLLDQLVDRNCIQFLQVRILLCKLEKAANICNLFRTSADLLFQCR